MKRYPYFFFLLIVCNSPGFFGSNLLFGQTMPVDLGATRQEVRQLVQGRGAGQLSFDLVELSTNQWQLRAKDSSTYRGEVFLDFIEDTLRTVRAEWIGIDTSYRFVMFDLYQAYVDQNHANNHLAFDEATSQSYRQQFSRNSHAKAAVFRSTDFARREVYLFHSNEEGAVFSLLWQAF